VKPQGAVFDKEWRASCWVMPVNRMHADFMIKEHYLGKWPGVCTLVLGAFRGRDLIGVIVFALPPRETSKRYGGDAWELARLWVHDAIPANAETWLIAQAVKYISKARAAGDPKFAKVQVLVSYADPSAGHAGTIYKAANWVADGRTDEGRKTPRFDYADAETGKRYSRRGHVPEGVTIQRIPRVSKHRFYYRLASNG
jgi:hypothetical protein